jgi:uncharacterized protein YfaP (DUF2135 family)
MLIFLYIQDEVVRICHNNNYYRDDYFMFKKLVFTALLAFFSVSTALAYDVQILSAVVKDQAIPDATLILQKNGQSSVQTKTGANGKGSFNAPFGGVDDATVSMIVKKEGYSNLVVKCPCSSLTYAISPNMESLDEMRVVLNWGAEPLDLDAHLAYPGNHVSFENKQGDDANLDVDHTDGFGPETITLTKKKAGVKYLYAVHNYSEGDQKGSSSISRLSNAKVFVYIGSSLVRTFTPPKGRIGNTWVVFGIGANGEFYDINKFADFQNRSDVGTFMEGIINSGDFASIPDVTTDQKALAVALNLQGEKAYHAKSYDEAASLYLDAINNNPEYSQAYSNLGLVYQRMGKNAEGLWANRKSIALASGANKKTVQASSYYNIGKIYEEKSDWQEALNNYEIAKSLKQHPAYDSGIAKMKQKLGH